MSRRHATDGATTGRRIYSLNEEAFSILTDDARYWIGFALADGCVFRKGYAKDFIVTLAATDESHLESLREFLGSTRPLRRLVSKSSNGTLCDAVALRVSSRRLTDDLIRYGVTPRKSQTAEVHPDLTGCPRFWAGVVDGDGSLSLACNPSNRQHVARPVMSLVGTRAVCESFAAFIRSRFPDYEGQIRRTKSIWETRVGGVRAAKLAEEMYATGPALPRKREMAKAFVQSFVDHPTPETFDWGAVTREGLLEAGLRLGSWQLVADELGATYTALRQQLPERFGITGKLPRSTAGRQAIALGSFVCRTAGCAATEYHSDGYCKKCYKAAWYQARKKMRAGSHGVSSRPSAGTPN